LAFIKGFARSTDEYGIVESYRHCLSLKTAGLKSIRENRLFDDPDNPLTKLRKYYLSPKYHTYLRTLQSRSKKLKNLARHRKRLLADLRWGRLQGDMKPAAELIVRFINVFHSINRPPSLIVSPIRWFQSRRVGHFYFLQIAQGGAIITSKYRRFEILYLEERKLMKSLKSLARDMKEMEQATYLSPTLAQRAKVLVRLTAFTLIGGTIASVVADWFDPLFTAQHRATITDAITETSKEVAFEREFPIDVTGDFTSEDLQLLSIFLRPYKGLFQQMGLTHIFIAKPSLQAEVDYLGQVHTNSLLLNHTMRLFSGKITKNTVDHEVAHFWHLFHILRVSKEFDPLWIQACDKYSGYNLVHDEGALHYVYSDGSAPGPKYGYVEAYGGWNIREDVATFVETIKNNSDIFDRVKGDYPIYANKIKLLAKYKFISVAERDMALGKFAGKIRLLSNKATVNKTLTEVSQVLMRKGKKSERKKGSATYASYTLRTKTYAFDFSGKFRVNSAGQTIFIPRILTISKDGKIVLFVTGNKDSTWDYQKVAVQLHLESILLELGIR